MATMNQPKDRTNHLQVLEEKNTAARKRRLKLEAELFQSKKQQQSDIEELKIFDAEKANDETALKKSLKELSEMQCQLAKVEACGAAEAARVEIRLKAINEYSGQFHEVFAKEKRQAELRFREQQEREREERERERVRKSEQEKNNKEDLELAISMETECDQLEQECAVLKKRNAAVLLLLRKNLFDAETRRRNLLQQSLL